MKYTANSSSRSLASSWRSVLRYLAHGLIISVPLAVTLWLLVWFFSLIDGLLGPGLEWLFGRPVPGLGFFIIFVLVTLIGFFGVKIGRRRSFDFLESRIMRIPIVGSIYNGAKQIMNSFATTKDSRFLRVVFMEFPRRGTYTVGLVTSEVKDRNGKSILNVFIPTAPNPINGFLQIVPESQVVQTKMSVDEAMKLIVSAGRVSHEDIARFSQRISPDRRAPVHRSTHPENTHGQPDA